MEEDSNLKYFIATAVIVVLLALGALFTYFPRWQHQKRVGQASYFLDSGRTEQAFPLLKEIYESGKTDSPFGQKYIDILVKQDPQEAARILEPTIKSGDATTHQMRNWIRCLVQLERIEEAIPLTQTLLDNNENAYEDIGLAGKLAFLDGNISEAYKLLNIAYPKLPNDPSIRFYRALTQGRQSSEIERVKAKAELYYIAMSDSQFAEEALLELITNQHLPLFRDDLSNLFSRWFDLRNTTQDLLKRPIQQLRLIAKRMAHSHPEEAFKVRQAIVEMPKTRRQDQLELVQLAHRIGEADIAKSIINNILSKSPDDYQASLLRAQNFIIQEQLPAAINLLGKLMGQNPNDRLAHQLLIVASFSSALDTSPLLKNKTLQSIIDHPFTNIKQSLASHKQQYQLRTEKKDFYINRAIERWNQPEHHTYLTSWLNAQDEPAKTIEIIQASPAKETAPLILNLGEAYIKTNQIEKLDALLASQKSKIPAIQYHFLKCSRCYHIGDKEGALQEWKTTYELALKQESKSVLLALARMHEIVPDKELLSEAFKRARQSGAPFSEQDWNDYFVHLLSLDNIDKAFKTIEEATLQFPNNIFFINNHCYLSLLLDKPAEEVMEKMKRIIEQSPDKKEFQVTLALAYHRAGKAQKALQIIEQTYLDLSNEGTAAQAIYAAILAANGRSQVASSYAQNIDRESLIQPEWALIEQLTMPTQAIEFEGSIEF